MKLEKFTIKILLGALLFFLCSTSIHAGFGISPTDISSEYLKPGASFEREFTISRSESLEEMDIYIESSLPEMESWFTYSPAKVFKLNQGETIKTFKILVNVPMDAEYKNYSGAIRVKAVPSLGDVKGISITQGVRLDANLLVTQDDFKKLSITSITTSDTEVGQPIKIKIEGENLGNIDASPTVKVQLMNLTMEVLEEKEIANFGFIKPNESSTLTAEFLSTLPIGEYFMQVSVILDNQEIRKERLVIKINEATATPVTPKDDTMISLVSRIGNFTRENKTFIIYVSIATLIALGIEVTIYSLSGKLSKKIFGKTFGRALASNIKYPQAVISFMLAFIVFLSFIFIPIIRKDPPSRSTIPQVKGLSISENQESTLNVLPPISVKRYLIYEQPDTSSKSIYTASEDEKFNVVDENNDWYKIILGNQDIGWLQKSIVKSVISDEK